MIGPDLQNVQLQEGHLVTSPIHGNVFDPKFNVGSSLTRLQCMILARYDIIPPRNSTCYTVSLFHTIISTVRITQVLFFFQTKTETINESRECKRNIS